MIIERERQRRGDNRGEEMTKERGQQRRGDNRGEGITGERRDE